MSGNEFIIVFLILAAADLYFSMVQRTTQLISRIGQAPQLGGFLNPKFIRFAFPLTLVKWGWVVYGIVSGHTTIALLSLFFSWLAAVVLPVPAGITLPAIRSQIAFVHELDEGLGQHLSEMTDLWEEQGSRR